MTDTNIETLSIREAAEFLDRAWITIYRQASIGRLDAFKDDKGHWRIPLETAKAYKAKKSS